MKYALSNIDTQEWQAIKKREKKNDAIVGF